MIDKQNEKLSRFASSVSLEIDTKTEEIKLEANKEKVRLLEQTREKILDEAYVKIQKAVSDAESKYRRAKALKEQEFRIQLLKHRQELSEKIFDSVMNKIYDFVNSDQYEEYLEKLTDGENLNNAVIRVSANDMKYSDMLKKYTGCEIESDDDIQLGGILIFYENEGIIIDKTFDSAFEDQQKVFSSKYNFMNTNQNQMEAE